MLNNLVLDGPFEKIQLPNRRLDIGLGIVWNHNTVTATKRVKPHLAVCLQFQAVTLEYAETLFVGLPIEHSAALVFGGNRIYSQEFLGVVGDEPIDDSQRYGFAVDYLQEFIHIFRHGIKLKQFAQKKFILSAFVCIC